MGVGVSGVYWGMAGSGGTPGPDRALGAPRGVGVSGGVRGVLGLAGSVGALGPDRV